MAPVGVDDDQLKVMRREANMPEFRSESAREDYERARRLRVVVRIVLVIVGLVAWSGFMYWVGVGRRGSAHAGGGATSDHDREQMKIEPVGSPGAKVRVQCILPESTDCHEPIIKFLQDTAKRHPDHIRVEFKGMNEFTEEDLADKAGAYCAAVLVNDRPDHEITSGGKVRTVNLVGTIPTHYSLWDLGETIRHIYELEYGKTDEEIFELPEGEEQKSVEVSEPLGVEVPRAEFQLTLPGFKELKTDDK